MWFDSGAMPFAQWHAPFENEDALRGALPGRLHLRGDRPDARVVLLAARDLDAAVRPAAVPQRRLPRPDPGRRGPEDVEVQGQHRRALGRHRPLRRRRVPLVLLHVQAAVGRLPLLRWTRSARASACSCGSCGAPTRSSARTRRGRSRDGGDDRPRPLGPLAARRDGRGGHRAPRRLRRHVRRPGDRRVRRRPLQLVRAPLARGASGRATRARFATLRESLVTVPSCSRRSRRSSPTRSTRTSTAPSRRVHLTDWPEPPARDVALERDMARRARGGAPRACGARRGEGQAAPAAARGRRRRRRRRARRDRAPGGRRARASSTSKALRFVDAGRRARRPRAQAQLPLARPAVRQGDAAGRGRGRGARRLARRGRAARGPPGRGQRRRPRPRAVGRRRPRLAAPLEGYQLEREGSHAVALELALDEELRREGLAREIVHAIQNARKAAGLAVEDRIALTLGGDAELLDVARALEEHVAGRDARRGGRLRRRRRRGEAASIEGRELRIGVARQPG